MLTAGHMQGTRCQLTSLSERCHQGNAIYGKGIAAGTAGDTAPQMEDKASRNHHDYRATIDTDAT